MDQMDMLGMLAVDTFDPRSQFSLSKQYDWMKLIIVIEIVHSFTWNGIKRFP